MGRSGFPLVSVRGVGLNETQLPFHTVIVYSCCTCIFAFGARHMHSFSQSATIMAST